MRADLPARRGESEGEHEKDHNKDTGLKNKRDP